MLQNATQDYFIFDLIFQNKNCLISTNTVKSQFVAALNQWPPLNCSRTLRGHIFNSSRPQIVAAVTLFQLKRGVIWQKQSLLVHFHVIFWKFCNCSRPLLVAALKQRPQQKVVKRNCSRGYKLRFYGIRRHQHSIRVSIPNTPMYFWSIHFMGSSYVFCYKKFFRKKTFSDYECGRQHSALVNGNHLGPC